MINNPNWQLMNNSAMRWCRVRLENEMANCCQLADFVTGRGEGCTDCMADCVHRHFDDLCNRHFGQACLVERFPFDLTGAPEVQVTESFCVPEACNNRVDRDALLAFYDSEYQDVRVGWLLNYNKGTLTCPGNELFVAVIVVVCVLLCCGSIPICWFVCVAPRERGKTLVSQADMQSAQTMDDQGMWGNQPGTNALRDAGTGEGNFGGGNGAFGNR